LPQTAHTLVGAIIPPAAGPKYLMAVEDDTGSHGSPDKIFRESFTELARFTAKEAALSYLKRLLGECLDPEVNTGNSELHKCWGRIA
jgi:hypothetical protein